MMPLIPIIVVDIFDVLGIDFVGPYSKLFTNEYVLLCINSVSKWVKPIPTNDKCRVVHYLL